MDIKITFPGGKRVNAEIEGMTIATDQSVKNGGDGSAPEPFKYFLASIGTCAGIYVLSFCQKNGIPTEGITLTQRHEYLNDPSGKPYMAKLHIEINVPGDFPEKYRDAIIRVAEQCAVKKAIMSPPEFVVKTVVSD
ncbi:MAG: OsmC family protein [Nitrospirae bacterium]|nr:OsmC family protein [Nitrospirota bacterium]MBF0593298.1 OsmC family protein [Nitrospirota bacterium]